MALSLNNLQAPKGAANKKKKRIGRGNASGTGTYAGRGLKGQRSRSGGRGGLKVKALRTRLQSVPKLRGFKSLKKKEAVVNLSQLETAFEAQAIVSPKSLVKKQLIDTPRWGVKILGDGELSKSLTFKKVSVSQSAKEKIEKAGGKIE